MSLGTLRDELSTCCAAADSVYWFRGENIKWDLTEVVHASVVPRDDGRRSESSDPHARRRCRRRKHRRHIVIMSNGGFGGIHGTLRRAALTRAAG